MSRNSWCARSAAFLALMAGIGHAQSARLAFDVTSVKRHVQGTAYEQIGCANGRFISRGSQLAYIIEWAYDLNFAQSRDLEEKPPAWVFQDGYDVEAKSAGPVSEAQCRQMMQNMLADRFKIAVHWESKPGQVYDLVVARGGPKMQKSADTDTGSGFNISVNGNTMRSLAPEPPKGRTMQEFAAFLSGFTQRVPVTDMTRLEGMYRINLRFSLGGVAAEDPDLGAALQQQLGLKLEEHKGTVEYFLLDHIERPEPN